MAQTPAARNDLLRSEIEKLVLKNMGMRQIHQALRRRGFKVTESTVAHNIKLVRAEYSEQRKQKMSERIDHELNVLEEVRRKAFDEYERSREEVVTRETITKNANADTAAFVNPNTPLGNLLNQVAHNAQPGAMTEVTEKVKTVEAVGDPKHLEVVLKASADIRKLLKVDPEEVRRIEVVNRDVGGYTQEELRRMDPAELARLVDESLEAA